MLLAATQKNQAHASSIIAISAMERSRSYSEKSSSSNNNNSTPASAHGLRCYSASYVTSKKVNNTTTWPSAAPSSSSSSSSASSKARIFGGPAELWRKKRVAGYRVYAVEGRVKGSLKSGVRWLKSKCTQAVDGWW